MAKIVKKIALKEVDVRDFRELLWGAKAAKAAQMSDEELLNTPYSELGFNIPGIAWIYEKLTAKRGIKDGKGKCMNEEEFHRGESDSRRWAESFARLFKDKTIRAIIRSANCA